MQWEGLNCARKMAPNLLAHMQWEGLNCARKMAPNLQAENNYETSNIFNEPTGFFSTVLNQLLKVLLQ